MTIAMNRGKRSGMTRVFSLSRKWLNFPAKSTNERVNPPPSPSPKLRVELDKSIYYPLQTLVDCFWQPPVGIAISYTENNRDVIAADLHSKKTIHETASGHDIGASDGGPTLTCSIQAEKNMKICLLSHDNKGSLPRFPVEGGVFFT